MGTPKSQRAGSTPAHIVSKRKGVLRIELIFLSNELMNPRKYHDLGVPLQFITFAFVQGKMYHHYQRKSTFVVQSNKRSWGSDVVYGALFLVNDHYFHIRSIDSYMACSKSALHRNHSYDLHHRLNTVATPITFSSAEDFCALKYKEMKKIRCEMYVGNPNQPKINHRLQSRSRIIDGLDKQHYKELIREVLT